ncbi:uncharacterized protein LOC125886567 [Epinephelus fuscoguttatus]|uniref:uncharacterized protein LOC125886567 n=1 Tax=Epinephelus fuscoguttatus TaxID=293821 RepID=UPI0020D17427|nr:uncharacterized protein LOC125886567 [Epinephelus fuscoguttatus]
MMAEQSEENLTFTRWRYKHYFKFVEIKGRNVHVKYNLCPRAKILSTSNSNLLKHKTTAHSTTKLVAKNPTAETDDERPSTSSKDGQGATAAKQQKLDFSAPPKTTTQTELYALVDRYVVENMLPLSTVESDSFRAITAKIPVKAGVRTPCRKTFSKYLVAEYTKMNTELKKTFEELEFLSTTADIWTAHNKGYIGVTARWIDPQSLERKKAALACRQFTGRHTYDSIATELENIHSSFTISHKVTATVTDNGSNFVKAFKVYQPVHDDDSEEEDDDDVTFVDLHEALQNRDEDDVITLPPHHKCASHTANLISCSDVDKWLLSRPEAKAVYRSATAKCTALWNRASRSAVSAETVDDVLAKKLLVPCTTRWNSFHDAVAQILQFLLTELNTISYKFGLKAMTEREYQFLREYCTAMKPLTVALDILQGVDNCFYGTLLPTLEMLMTKTMDTKSGLQLLVDLPEAVVKAIKTRFAEVLESESAILAAVTLPRFKLRWLRTQERKDNAKASLLAEVAKVSKMKTSNQVPTHQHATSAPTLP